MNGSEAQGGLPPLFAEFTPPGIEDWRSAVAAELDGADPEKKLTWVNPEGIPVRPLYTRADIDDLPHLGGMPGVAPFVRDTRTLGNLGTPWLVNQLCDTADPQEAGTEISAALGAGQTAVTLRLEAAARCGDAADMHADATRGVALRTLADSEATLGAAIAGRHPVYFNAGCAAPVMLAHAAILSGRAGVPLNGGVAFDPCALLAAHGRLPAAVDDVFGIAAAMIRFVEQNDGEYRCIGISAEPYHNAGATVSLGLACALAAGADTLRRLIDAGIPADTAARSMRFTIPIGANFFFELSKLRAGRAAWAAVTRAFGVEDPRAQAMCMHARTSWRQHTAYDPWVNMLRGTVEAFAAATGGAASIQVEPFDAHARRHTSELGRRVARNTQIILRDEAQLGRVIDPGAGSYYIETLTDSIGRQVWDLFQRIEAAGGMLRALEHGLVQELVEESASVKRANVSARRETLVGINQYPHLTEAPLAEEVNEADVRERLARRAHAHSAARDIDAVQRAVDAVSAAATTGREGLIEAMMAAAAAGATVEELQRAVYPIESASDIVSRPLRPFRVSEVYERMRAAVERHDPRPAAVLLPMGPAVWRRARAGFAAGVFGAGGFTVVDASGYETAEAAVRAAVEAHAAVAVLCSDDDSYLTLAEAVLPPLRAALPDVLVVVAGMPKDAEEQLRALGVDEFIHLRADVGAVLHGLCTRLGIAVPGHAEEEEAGR